MSVVSATAGPNRRVFRPAAARSNRVPDSLLNDPELTRDVDAVLPKNYNFEVPKTLWRIQTLAVKRVALQVSVKYMYSEGWNCGITNFMLFPAASRGPDYVRHGIGRHPEETFPRRLGECGHHGRRHVWGVLRR